MAKLQTIRRHIEDHPGYYHDEEEITYLLSLLDEEKANHQKTAKKFVDMETYAKFLEKKYNVPPQENVPPVQTETQ